MTRVLTEKLKADRKVMALKIKALAESLGATADIEWEEPTSTFRKRRTIVHIKAARGLRLNVDLDGDSCQPDVHVLSWHIDLDTDARLADSFGNINRHHFRKATYYGDGFEGLFGLEGMVELGLCKARDGDAFSAEREAAKIAVEGTAAERNARWAVWREEEERLKREAAA